MTTITVTVKVTGGTENDIGTLVDDIETAVTSSLMHQEPEDRYVVFDWYVVITP